MIARHDAAVADKIVGAIMEANASLVPAHLGAARGEGTININRRVRAKDGRPAAVGRNPEGTVDRELIVFRIDDAQGKPLAVLVNFQCHGTVLAYENKTISPDWIGMTRKVIEDSLPGALALYFQGAAGDQGPMEGFTGDLAVPHRLGRILGHQAAALALSIETVRREPFFEGFVESTAYQAKQHWRVKGPRDATLRFATVTVQAPPRTYTREELARMERQVADAEAAVKKLGPNADRWEKHQAEARLRRFSDLLRSWRNPRTETLPVDVQALRIGEYALVAMPGEPFSGIGAAVKKASPFAVTMFCGYSSGSGGDYMPIASEYEHGGYEVERSPYGTGAADLVIREAQALLRKLKD
ncbi:MAG: neutral/alkaline non-lysosomal ceramidase N-terminal domain-containing protein [Bryobacterales bacterium]|nr:neutral/alkaline non-lysosomal ceramidase N-terminal domain-containing protein [Bryobacterales bacterium]